MATAMSLDSLESELSGLLSILDGASRRALAREIAQRLRSSQQQRIAAQQNPDGTPYSPRKPQLRGKKGRLRRTMFSKLRTARFLKMSASADAAVVEFTGRVERIARVHQLGLADRVRPGGPTTTYPARELLGLSDADMQMVEEAVLSRLSQ